jgi:serine protease Do
MKGWTLTTLALVLGFACSSLLVGTRTHAQNPPVPKPAVAGELTSYRGLVKKVLPAVVSIEARVRGKAKVNPPPVFGEPPPKDYGSGFLLAGGVVVTCNHIVQEADSVVVRLHDGRKLVSKDIRGDARSDLAVILLDVKGAALPALELGESAAMEIGDRVLAVGAPFGLTGSVTHGIVSGTGRDLNLNQYEDFLQTDAAINPGNSGGPLINLEGKVVGVCAAIKSRTGGFQGIGLAVASDLAKGVVEALRTEGVVRRAYLGLQARELEPGVGPRLGVPADAGGVVAAQVYANTPAARAGLQPGDVLTKIAGKAVADAKALQGLVARLPIGKPAAVEFYRDGKVQTGEAPIEEVPAAFAATGVPAPRGLPPGLSSIAAAKFGMDLADLPAGLARDLGYPAGARGVLITGVQPGGGAAEAGLFGGMLITQVEGKAPASAAGARQMLENAPGTQGVLLQVQSPQGGVTYVLLPGT